VKLPTGYAASGKDLKVKDKVVGHQILITKEGQVSKVNVQIDFADRSEIAARRGATKAYVNSFAEGMGSAGYKVESSKIPDIAAAKFDTPIGVDLTLVNGEGKKLFSHQEIFFTDKGFMVQVLADDAKTLESLTTWAKTIKPKKAEKR
jgi:hypothetical protein